MSQKNDLALRNLETLKMEVIFCSETSADSERTIRLFTQKIDLFVMTAVIASNPEHWGPFALYQSTPRFMQTICLAVVFLRTGQALVLQLC
jgi:hypothetical protein